MNTGASDHLTQTGTVADAVATDDRTPVTVIGLGAMGSAVASAFLENGHPTTVWNRSAGKADDLVASGASRAASVTDAVSASPLTIVCVLNYGVVHELLDPVSGAISGRTLVNLTNGTPQEANQMGAWATTQNANYVDGGIMAVPSLIAGPNALILYSGSQEAFESHRQDLERLGTSMYVGAEPGLAALHDLALLSGMYGMFAGFLQAVALVGTEEVDATQFTTSLLIPWLHAMTTTMPDMARQIDTGDYTSQEANLAMQTSGAGLVEFSESIGIRGDLLAPLQDLMNERVADGHGGDDLASVIELLRRPGT